MADEIDEGMNALREVEIEWLAEELSRAIKNLGYPVGMGAAPHPEQIKSAATRLFDRYAKMIEMARRQSLPAAEGNHYRC